MIALVDKFLFDNANNNINIKINPSLIKDQISKIKNKKDKISNLLLKNLPDNCIKFLATIIEAIINLNYFTVQWKNNIIIPIPKTVSPSNLPCNYSPITLLSGLSKIAENFILNLINGFLDTHKIIINEQHGFRRHHCTDFQLLLFQLNPSIVIAY